MNSVADVWDNVLSQLKGELSETTIATWFDELEAVDIQGNVFILHCSNDFKKGYIESLFMKNIKASLHDIFSTDFEVRILDDQDYAEFQGNAPKKQSERFTSAEFTFETFVVGPSTARTRATLLVTVNTIMPLILTRPTGSVQYFISSRTERLQAMHQLM